MLIQGLKPKSRRVGQYRNEPYYARTDLADLHSKTRWIRHGRVVKESELPRPHKLVKKLFGCGKKLTFTEEVLRSLLSLQIAWRCVDRYQMTMRRRKGKKRC